LTVLGSGKSAISRLFADSRIVVRGFTDRVPLLRGQLGRELLSQQPSQLARPFLRYRKILDEILSHLIRNLERHLPHTHTTILAHHRVPHPRRALLRGRVGYREATALALTLKSCQAPKPPNPMILKRINSAYVFPSTRYNRYRAKKAATPSQPSKPDFNTLNSGITPVFSILWTKKYGGGEGTSFLYVYYLSSTVCLATPYKRPTQRPYSYPSRARPAASPQSR